MKNKPTGKGTRPQMKRQLDYTQVTTKKLIPLAQVSARRKKTACFIPKQKVFDTQQEATSCKRTRFNTDHTTKAAAVSSSVMERALEVQRSLHSEIPSFVKSMLKSHVAGGFWLGLPRRFCTVELPKYDTTMVLMDECGTEYKAKYLAEKTGLSGGWRGFSIAHNLLEGDVLVFGLVQPTKFMVYIVRRYGRNQECALVSVFPTLEACIKQEDFDLAGEEIKRWKNGEGKTLKDSQDGTLLENLSGSTTEKQLENGSDEDGSEVLEKIRFLEHAVDFKKVKSIKDFSILVNGLVINSELPKHIQSRYYELCCSQKTYLHDHLLDGLNCKLAAGIISETINIADAIRASKLTTSRENFCIWTKTLKGFQEMGMKVGFLQARLEQLMSFGFEANRKIEARLERTSAEEKIRDLEASLLHAKEVKRRLDAEIEALNSPVEKQELMFQQLAEAPW